MDILAYNIKPVLSLEIVHIAGDIDGYYFGYRILELGYYGQLNHVKRYKSGFTTDTEAIREGIEEFKKLLKELEEERNSLPF